MLMKENEIITMYGRDYRAMTIALLKEAGLAERIPSKNMLIGLKPNLVSQALPSEGATTHPEIVAGVIEYLQENGFFHLVVLEGSWVGDKTSEAFLCCGYRTLAEDYGVTLLDTQKDKAYTQYKAGNGDSTQRKQIYCFRHLSRLPHTLITKKICETCPNQCGQRS